MMDFNIDYVLGHLPKKGPHTSRSIALHANDLAQQISRILKKSEANSIRKTFIRLLLVEKPKVSKFSFVEKLVFHRIKSAFYRILQSSLKSKVMIESKNNFIRYPISILQRIISNKQISSKQKTLKVLRINNSKFQERQELLQRMIEVMKDYIQRNITSILYRNLSSLNKKSIEYQNHAGSLEYLFQTIRVKKLFEAFTSMSIKTITKNLADLEKEKNHKRDRARVSLIKRSEIINELKRKVTNAVGQVNEAQINNNRRRVNGSRENGAKLIKLNQEIRIIQIKTEDLEHQVDSMDRQIKRKQEYLNNRLRNDLSFEYINELYHFIKVLPQQAPAQLILDKLEFGTTKLQGFKEELSFIVMENIKLKHEINLYQKIGEGKKTQNYNNCSNQNTNLKMVINSLLKFQFMNQHIQQTLEAATEVQGMVAGFVQERIKIKQGL